jgi:hypothetical protein
MAVSLTCASPAETAKRAKAVYILAQKKLERRYASGYVLRLAASGQVDEFFV